MFTIYAYLIIVYRCPELIGSLRKLIETYHSPPNFHVPLEQGGTDVVVTPGSLEGIYLVSSHFEFRFE